MENQLKQANNSLIWNEIVGHLPLQKPIRVKDSASLEKVIQKMQKQSTGCVLVTDEKDKLVGLFTERDLMTKYVGTPLAGNTQIGEIMTKDPMTLPYETTIAQATYFMGAKQFRHLPIMNKNGKVKGLLSVRGLVYFIAEHLPSAVLNLPPDEKKIPKYVEGG